MKVFITYSNDKYKRTKRFSLKMAKYFGRFDSFIQYSPDDIDKNFYEKNKEILSIDKGNGLWLWKPYFIYKTLLGVNYNDIVFYCDAGSFFIRNANKILKTMKDDIWVSDIPLIEKQYTKKECFFLMDCNEEFYRESNQIQANFIAIRKNEKTIRFIKEWLDYCCNINIISPISNNLKFKNDSIFIEHREDQSVLSLLCKKWNINTHLDPSQYGRIPTKYYEKDRIFKVPKHDKEYPVCLILHRTADVNLKVCINQWFCSWLPLFIVKLIYRRKGHDKYI